MINYDKLNINLFAKNSQHYGFIEQSRNAPVCMDAFACIYFINIKKEKHVVTKGYQHVMTVMTLV